MNTQLKAIIAFILLLTISSQVQANKRPSGDGERPERPTFSSLDSNSDGKIDFDEFSSKELPFGDHQTVFNSIDTDSNGSISQEEFASHKPPRRQNGKGQREE